MTDKYKVGPGKVDSSAYFMTCLNRLSFSESLADTDLDFEISPGYSPIGFTEDQRHVPIRGTGGRILAVWSEKSLIDIVRNRLTESRTCTTLAMFQFMGGEIVLVTAGEAKSPRRDLPTAARYMYMLPVSFYLIAILLLGSNINYLDPRIYHPHVIYALKSRLEGIQTAARSPFVIAIENAGIQGLPGFLDACFLLSALTAAFVHPTVTTSLEEY